MRAAVLPGLNEKVVERDVQLNQDVGPGMVRVAIRASGVCHSDLSCVDGTLPQPLPAVLGHEGAGEIVEVGEGVTDLQPGDHVVITWVVPCNECFWCLHGQPYLCQTHLLDLAVKHVFKAGDEPLFGFVGIGTMAEEIIVPQGAAIKIDDDVPLDVASLLGCGVTTGVGAALNTAKVQPGSSVCVIGCGGVGISVIQGARIAGAAEIVAVDLVDRKLEMARKFGATHAVKPDGLAPLSEELTKGVGFDYAFEVIGLPATVRQTYEATRRGGSTIIVGAGRTDDQISFTPFELFYTERKILPCLYGSADVRTEFHRLIRLWRQGKLDLEGMITQRIDIGEVQQAFDAMKAGEVIRSVITFK